LRNLKEKINKIANDKEDLKNKKKGFKKVNHDDSGLMLEKETVSHQIKLLTNVNFLIK